MDVADVLFIIVFPLAVYSAVVTVCLISIKARGYNASRRAKLALSHAYIDAAHREALRAKADEALHLSNVFQKFVPKQFLEHFEDKDVSALEVGTAVEDDVAILCCDIRGFSNMSEELKPYELMRFLNSYYLRMNDPIHKSNGFIDKFIGDAIMALFDHPGGTSQDKSRDAIKAAIALQNAVSLYNKHRRNCDYRPISVGVGVHFGSVIIGTVGSHERMDTTVIGDNVNVAFRLESLTSKYQVGIVVSEEVLQTAELENQQLFSKRALDFVKVKGRGKAIKIFEVLDHLPDAERETKLAMNTEIELGLAHRMNEQWSDALACFNRALNIMPDDQLILHHMELCHRCQTAAQHGDWDTSLSFSEAH